MSSKLRTLFVAIGVAAITCTLSRPFHVHAQAIEQSANGVTLHSSSGALHLAVCSERVIRVEASRTDKFPESNVPTVIRPCGGASFTISHSASTVTIKTSVLKVEIDRATNSVEFLTAAGQTVLSEQGSHGRTITPIDVDGMRTNEIGQDFLLSPNEALYGLGQHQEGFLDLRDIPVRLLQANTNIAIPFLISTNGYGLLWNNAALTNFDPATVPIRLDGDGEGTFQTGAEGEYGFLLSGNGRDKLQLSVNDEKVIDLKNMWLPWSAGGKVHLAANTTYRVTAVTGGNTQLFARPPSEMMEFRSQAGEMVDYYFIYGPAPNEVIAQYRELTGPAPLLPRWAYGFWQCRERYSSQQQILDTAAEFRKRQIPVDVLV